MNAARTADQLAAYFASPQQAVSRLSMLQEAASLLRVFRYFFPKEFAVRNQSAVMRADGLHKALTECLQLISRNLFEIPDGFPDELMAEDLPLSYIPTEPLFPEWWNEDFDEIMLLWQVLLILSGVAEVDDSENEVLRAAGNARQQWHDKIIDCHRLARLCRRAASPLCWLNLALMTLDHSTGNPWLDASYECPITGFEWTIRNVRFLQKMWREAGRVCDQIMTLNVWLVEDASRIHQLLDVWAQALMLPQKDERT